MKSPPGSLLTRAIDRFDRINATDPRTEEVEEGSKAKELVYAHRMSGRLAQFQPNASEALQLAARAQHIARWQIPRSDYPRGRAGYKRWRTRMMHHHAVIAGEVLEDTGYDAATINVVKDLLQKRRLKQDSDAQTLEDVVCLVFLEHYFDAFGKDHEDEKLVGILQKTWAKMSPRGRTAALALPLSDRARRLIAQAVNDGDTRGDA